MRNKTLLLIVVASLGYFVDIYDLVLFNVVKNQSLQQILPNASPDEIKETAMFLFNMQMIGMLVGGILWGILGDRKGRLTVLFGSILLYSAANVINAFTFNIPLYAVVRIVAGIGLAGELGAGITMVSETMSKENRGYGTMIIVTFGALGAVVAALVGKHGDQMGQWFSHVLGTQLASWQVAYIIGGVFGLMLLLLRVGTIESTMFTHTKNENVQRGNMLMLFKRKHFGKYLKCILIGLPVWFIIGLVVVNAQAIFAKELGVVGHETVKSFNGDAIMYAYLGLSAGDLVSGLLSQVLKSRKKVVVLYLCMTLVVLVVLLFFSAHISVGQFYFLSFLLGFSTGYWAIFVSIGAEQFGTNIRSTVANTVPNFVRGMVPPITWLFKGLLLMGLSNVISTLVVGIICLGLAFWAIVTSAETFAKDLDYIEEK